MKCPKSELKCKYKLWFWVFYYMLSGSGIYVCFFVRSKFHLWGMFCDDGCNRFPPSFLISVLRLF